MTQIVLPFLAVINVPAYRMTFRDGDTRKVIYVRAHTVNL